MRALSRYKTREHHNISYSHQFHSAGYNPAAAAAVAVATAAAAAAPAAAAVAVALVAGVLCPDAALLRAAAALWQQ